jgi:hypothetical protein
MALLNAVRIPALLLAVVLTAAGILLFGCRSYPVTYFPSQIGQKRDMVADGTGDLTHFEIVNPPTSDYTNSVNIHITKTQARALLAKRQCRCGIPFAVVRVRGSADDNRQNRDRNELFPNSHFSSSFCKT